MSSSPWEWLWNGDEDVATPFLTGAVSGCALWKRQLESRLQGMTRMTQGPGLVLPLLPEGGRLQRAVD
jgi:hypothetical protein